MSDDFRKGDADKPRLDLWPSEALFAGGRAFSYGARKYAPGNWAKCPDPARYLAATMRHLAAWNGGEERDPESGLSHLDLALASMAMLVGLVERQHAAAAKIDWEAAAKATAEVLRELRGER